MANSFDDSAADHRDKHLSINPPHQIFKDIHGSDSAIPLSPQWLLSKPGEKKTAVGAVEAQPHSDAVKSAGNGEETPDKLKKKDVFRPSLLDPESGRHDRWRDEERDTLSTTLKKDRWRNGDKDFGADNNKKVDRWDNVGGPKHFGEQQRRPQNDRWTDSGNKDAAATEQRRESKWNSRWGPDDKEHEVTRNKWDDSGKDGEGIREKGPSVPSGDGEPYRPWRPSQGRGRGEALHNQSTPNKQVPSFSHSRGRGDSPAVFSAGRGRISPGGSLFSSASNQSSHPPGAAFDKGGRVPGEAYHLRYSRMKLLDVYRMSDIKRIEKFPDGFIEVPSLTSEQSLDPMALCAPSSDEVTVLEGIEKGKVVSSGVPQTSKDGPTGRNPVEFSQPSRIKPAGSREEMTYGVEESKDESGETRIYPDDKFRTEASREGYHVQASPWRQPVGERPSRISHDWNDPSADIRHKSSDNAWSHAKDSVNHSGGNVSRGESRWQPSMIFDREREVQKPLPSSPEELSLYYKDPQGLIQGPFSGADIIGWLEAGYFGIDLLVRHESAPNDSPFSLLSDVMPHLRAKAAPPPGFTGAKQNESVDAAGMPTFHAAGNVHSGVGEPDMLQNDMRYKHLGGTVAENRFIESLMSGGLNIPSQGIQGYPGNSSLQGTDGGGDMYLLAKRLELERQRTVPSPYPYWPAQEPANLMPGSENAQQPTRSPSADLLSLLQGMTERSSPATSGPLPATGFQTQTLFGAQQQRLPEQNLPLTGLLRQPMENNPGGMLSPDMMLTPGLSQDQQSLNLLQQQQLLLQLSAGQTNLSPQQQRVLIEKMLLLKQQQRQEEQQQLLRQQQQLFSQALADQQRSQQRFGEPAYGPLQPSFDALSQQVINQQIQVPVSHQERGPSLTDLRPVTHATNQNAATFGTSSLHHQLFGNIEPRIIQGQGTVITDQSDDLKTEYKRTTSAGYMNSLYSEKPVLNVEEESASWRNIERPTPNSSVITEQVSAPQTYENKSEDVYSGERETSSEIPAADVKNNEVPGGRKTSEKKSKKQRANKQSADTADVSVEAKSQNKKSSDTLIDNTHLSKSSAATVSEADSPVDESLLQKTQVPPVRGWKPAPGFKPKSLLEIQMEEQKVAQAEALAPKVSTSVSSVGSPAPWGGIVTYSDASFPRETHGESVSIQSGAVKSESVSTKSQMHDSLADDALAKSRNKEREVMEATSKATAAAAESFDDDNFIDARESKKSRKKSARAKNSAAKSAAAQVLTVDTSLPKSSRVQQQQQEKEALPAIPSGPSLGDFVLWKGETANSSPPAAAWSTAPKQSTRPNSLRDILREQEKLTTSSHPPPIPVPPTTQRSTPSQVAPQGGGNPSWSRSASSPTQAVSQTSSQSKSKGDDDLFWGPIEQSSQETKQGDFPRLASQNSWGTKNTSGKANAGSSQNRQKSVSSASTDRVLSSPVVTKEKKEAVTKLTEANGFRDWCRNECFRLLGSEDTSVLEFCLKLSRSEAESLLIENLGSFDPEHKFIDKFLNYKDLLPSEVVEIAFQSKGKDSAGSGVVVNRNKTSEDYYYNTGASSSSANDGFSKVGGKKKTKKGKKVNLSASVLGFNVVSNRIMMGEIQSIED